MQYEMLQKTYESLTAEQQLVVYNLAVSLRKLNSKKDEVPNVFFAQIHTLDNISPFNKKYGV